MMRLLTALFFASAAIHPVRLAHNPIVTPELSASLGDNINGPSLIRVPAWVQKPFGKYYLYFAHHQGKFIRLAYADQLEGPWKIYEPGTLQLKEAGACHDHIASPDVHIDDATPNIPRELLTQTTGLFRAMASPLWFGFWRNWHKKAMADRYR
jgi:hypothetical protein